MKFDKSKLKAGDVCVLRCGGRLVVDSDAIIGGYSKSVWGEDGRWSKTHGGPFDIISVEPAHVPVMEVFYFGYNKNNPSESAIRYKELMKFKCFDNYKITITDGKAEIEKVE